MSKRNEITIGIVVSQTNYEITHMMLKRAEEHARFLGVKVKTVVEVPGAFEIPFAVKKLLEDDEIDGVATLGAIITGETKHDEVIAAQASRKIMDLALEYSKPVSLGISGPGMSYAQAKQRVDSFGKNAVESVVKMIKAFH